MNLCDSIKYSIYSVALLTLRATFALMKFRRSRYNYVIYKVDRIGDWFIAQGAIQALVRAKPGRGLLLVSSLIDVEFVAKHVPGIEVRTLHFKNEGIRAILANFGAALQLASDGAFRDCIVLRHKVTLLREFLIRIISADVVTLVDESDLELEREYPWLKPRRGPRETVVYAAPGVAGEVLRGYAREHMLHFLVVQRHLGLTEWADLRTRLASFSRSDWLVVCPFGSASIRDYPPAAWGELIEGICRMFNLTQVVFPVTVSAVRRTEELIRVMRLSPKLLVRLVDSPTLDSFVDAVVGARYVLTVESAAAHIAACSDQEGVVLIGGGHYGLYGPWGFSDKLKWVTNRLDCFGCNWTCVRPAVDCITQIKPSQILAEIAVAAGN